MAGKAAARVTTDFREGKMEYKAEKKSKPLPIPKWPSFAKTRPKAAIQSINLDDKKLS